ncbi:F-box protein At2g02240-like [Oryza glaberrima]|uniref:F-box protein At2g02240-like n=1 Tax=Oryza glaberrima TaxID=4538 RepID=UPI00224C3D21|nr:F-box protein At2g02240-like [Oryza glaberrima]
MVYFRKSFAIRPATLEILHKLEETETVHATCSPVQAQISSTPIPKLMNDLKLMAVTFSRQPSTRVERYEVFSPVPSLSKPPTNKIFWVSRSLRITWGDTPGHWRWISLPNSRFAECAELLDVHWLAVIGEISPKDLTIDTPYAAYLVVVATSRVSVDPAARSGASDVSYPTERDDGWMEVKLAEFSNDERMLTEAAVIVDFREVNDHVKKSGLIVEGLEFRPTIH